MLENQVSVQEKEFDPFDDASNPVEKEFNLFGLVEINAWACGFQKGTKGGVPYDPAIHEKRHTMIDIYIQPLAEIDVQYPKSLEFHDVNWSVAWSKITLPSIKNLGFENVREINGKWARVARVPTGQKYEKKDKTSGQPTGEMADITAFKFVEFYANEDICRTAYLAAGGKPMAHAAVNVPVTVEDSERQTAAAFLKVIVTNAAKGKPNFAEAQTAVETALAQYPTVNKFFNAQSVETGQLITEITGHLPF